MVGREIEKWHSPSQAGAIIGTSGQWVTQLCRDGKLRGVQTALGWLIDPDDLERMREERVEALEARINKQKQQIAKLKRRRTIKEPAVPSERITVEQAREAVEA